MPVQKCIYCGAKAVRWCDFVLGFEDKHGDGLYHSFDDPIERCDAPLCEEHARYIGNIHFKGPPPIGGFETVDHCVGHDGYREWRPLLAGEAEQLRYRHRCQAAGSLRLLARQQPDQLPLL
jgi:hypothetical protein